MIADADADQTGSGPASSGSPSSRRRLQLRPGWLPAIAASALGAITTTAVTAGDADLSWLSARLAMVALALLGLGMVLGSERVVGLAGLPMLVGALLSADRAAGPAWGRSLIIGCLWYLTAELAWASIEQRDETVRTAAVGRQRRREVSVVVIITIAVGSGGALLASFAPTRTLLVQGLVMGSVLSAMVLAVRQMSTTSPEPDRSGSPVEPVSG